tara:strand:+ start:860 stop:1591 length:732 start_codon:yes stop_codon:yes gene_type:complete
MSLFSSLTLVGVGPGDPGLLTLAAVEAIKQSTIVAYPVADKGQESVAFQIASSWIPKEKKLLPLIFPMVNDIQHLQRAWKEAGQSLATLVAKNEEVVFLCQGDVSLFASASYVLLEIKKNHPECPLKIVPGVTAISAAAAAGSWPLSLQRSQIRISPTPNDPKDLELLLDEVTSNKEVLILLKLGSRWEWVRKLLEKQELLSNTLFAQRVGFQDERIMNANQVDSISDNSYFSLLIIGSVSLP